MSGRASEYKKGKMTNEERKARLKQRCMDDVASKRAKLVRSLRNAPGSVSQVGHAIVESMQSEDPGVDPDDPHAGLTEAEYQELMSSLEVALVGLVEEEERAAKEAEQAMMEMFQATVTLSPSEAAQAEADAEAAASASVPGAEWAEDGSSTMADGGAAAPLAGGGAAARPAAVVVAAGGGAGGGGGGGGGGAVADAPTGVPCVLCGAESLLQRYSVIFCANPGCGFRLDTTGDALSVEALSAQAFRVVGAHNTVCESAPGIYERHGVLFLECAECMTCEVLA